MANVKYQSNVGFWSVLLSGLFPGMIDDTYTVSRKNLARIAKEESLASKGYGYDTQPTQTFKHEAEPQSINTIVDGANGIQAETLEPVTSINIVISNRPGTSVPATRPYIPNKLGKTYGTIESYRAALALARVVSNQLKEEKLPINV